MAKSTTNGTTPKGPTKRPAQKKTVAQASSNPSPATATPMKEPEVTHREEAKSRFNAALEEAKAGAAALKAEAGQVVGSYRDQAKGKRTDLMADAKDYGTEAKARASELAVEGKAKASDALAALGQLVAEPPRSAWKCGSNSGRCCGARCACRGCA